MLTMFIRLLGCYTFIGVTPRLRKEGRTEGRE